MAVHNIEWTIANFSCWNSEVHGSTITSPQFSLSGVNRQFQLFDNSNGKLEVKLTGNNHNSSYYDKYSGDYLSLISSNGSVICTKEISGLRGNPFSVIFSEFKLRDLVAQIRKNEALYQDQLTVRCRFKNASCEIVECIIRTTIKVHEISVKVPSEKFDELIEGNPIQVLRFPLEDDEDDDERVQIELHEGEITYSSVIEMCSTSERKMLVSIHTSVLNEDDAVLKTIEDDQVYIHEGRKKTLKTLTKKEVKEKHCSLFINLKIIPPKHCEYRGHFYVDEGIYVALPNSLKSGSFSFVSLEKSKIITPSNCTDDDSVVVLTKELMCLFQDHDFSDFQLKCGGVSLPVHKNILSARSPVFKRLVSSDMREAASGSVDIEDLDAPTLARFLAFLYTGSVEDLQGESALKLYYAADKYEVPSLKRECVSVLSASVSVSNVCDILSLADRHQDDQLKSVAHVFILRNFNQVLGSSEWESFMNRESLLAVKTLTMLARAKSVVKASTS